MDVMRIISLEAQNSLFYRSWELSRLRDGYYLSITDSTSDFKSEGYIPTAEALKYIALARDGKLNPGIFCFGCKEITRAKDGSWYGYTYVL